ncbi:MAG: hypothetical protein ACK4RK_12420 [Gemmataceae bacterium]
MVKNSDRLVLRDLSLPTRWVLASFLIAVGIGYFTALAQLHMQHASAGNLLPSPQDVEHVYHGQNTSQLERLITADEHRPFNGSGQMSAAFTTESLGWRRAIRERALAMNLDPNQKDDWNKAEQAVRADRHLEVQAILDWIHAGADKQEYQSRPASASLAGLLTPDLHEGDFFSRQADNGQWTVHVSEIIEARCVRCHSEAATGPAAQIHLEKFEVVQDYLQPETSGAISLTKLTQSTHAHLLAFATLFGMTGLVFSFTSYPGWVRGIFAPLTLVAQVVEVGFWWLSRLDPHLSLGIVALGGVVGMSLLVQIFGGLFNMFDKAGKTLLLLLILLALAAGVLAKNRYVDGYLESRHHAATPATEQLTELLANQKNLTPAPRPMATHLERLLVADERLPFNGDGQMSAAFTTSSAGWRRVLRERAEEMGLDPKNEADLHKAEQAVRQDRQLEARAIVEWIRAGGQRDNYEKFAVSEDMAKQLEKRNPNEEFFLKADDGQWHANILYIVDFRCVRCHAEGKGGGAGEIHLEKFEVVQDYLVPDPKRTRVQALPKLGVE